MSNLSSNSLAFTAIGARNAALGAGAILDLRPSAGKFRSVSVGPINTISGLQCAIYDGTNFDIANPIGDSGFGQSATGYSGKNTSGGGVVSNYAGFDRG